MILEKQSSVCYNARQKITHLCVFLQLYTWMKSSNYSISKLEDLVNILVVYFLLRSLLDRNYNSDLLDV